MRLDQSQLEAFFTRIGLSYAVYQERTRNRAMLTELCHACARTIPFENLDILQGKLLSLDPEALYEKIVTQHRGGNCFEINGICGVFLRSLGFGVEDYFSRFFRDANGQIPMRRHRLLKVQAEDGVFLWDIGIGMRSPADPLLLVENLEQRQNGECYKFVKEPFYGWVLYEYHKEEWLRILSFTEEPQADVDFVTACVWCELHPNSPFNKQNMICIKTPGGRKTLDGNVYKEFFGDTIQSLQELTKEEIPIYLEKEFRLRIPE